MANEIDDAPATIADVMHAIRASGEATGLALGLILEPAQRDKLIQTLEALHANGGFSLADGAETGIIGIYAGLTKFGKS